MLNATWSFVLWPLLVTFWFCHYISDGDPAKFARIVGGQKKGEKKEAQVVEREALKKKVANAERELEIGGNVIR